MAERKRALLTAEDASLIVAAMIAVGLLHRDRKRPALAMT